MIIDEEIIEGGIDEKLIAELISRHEQSLDRMIKLKNYYLGRHEILARRRKNNMSVNNRVVCNHAKYIVDMIKSYLVGNPVTYSCSDGFDIEVLKNSYLAQDIASLDCEIEKEMGIFGKCYELIYSDENSMPMSIKLSPLNTFIVYSCEAAEKPLFGIHYFKRYDIKGNVTGVCAMVIDPETIYTYESRGDSFFNMKLAYTEAHYFGELPMIEYRNNEECQGDFEQIIPLIDAYNLLQSDRINDKEQFVDAFLFLTGIELDSEQAQKLREERILMGYEGASAQYLSKVMSENDIKVLRDDIKEDIHRFAMVPDLSDESFGGNLSGVAIKYKLMGFEQHIGNKERYFSQALRKRFKLYNNFLYLKGSMEKVPMHRVDVEFTRNLPVNELEISEMINNLRGIVSPETLLSRLSFVSDPKEEAEIVENSNMVNKEVK